LCIGWDSYEVLTEDALGVRNATDLVARRVDSKRVETATVYQLTDLGRTSKCASLPQVSTDWPGWAVRRRGRSASVSGVDIEHVAALVQAASSRVDLGPFGGGAWTHRFGDG